MRIFYPFSAIVGQEEMKTALILTAVDPGIGGVLIRGHKGTAKSTAARALAAILPPLKKVSGCPFNCDPEDPKSMHHECRNLYQQEGALPAEISPVSFVELPLSATEDRVVGTLHIEHALKTGERRFDPGILASANRGILYIDEVNLLEDHLVDMILDAAASGYNIVEREGISLVHPSRFILIGTMNPEEGELRPQFIDRFGLSVSVKGIEKARARIDIVKRRIVFESSPESFIKKWTRKERLISDQIMNARKLLLKINVPDTVLDLAVRVCIKAKVRGHRADITLIKAASELAAFLEKAAVSVDDLKAVLPLVISHRMESSRFESLEKKLEKIDELLQYISSGAPEPGTETNNTEEDAEGIDLETMKVPGAGAVGSMLFTFLKKKIRKKHVNRSR